MMNMDKTVEAIESLVLQSLIQAPEQTDKLKHYFTPIVREIVQEVVADLVSREVGRIAQQLDNALAEQIASRVFQNQL